MKNQILTGNTHPDLSLASQLAYKPSGLLIENIQADKESADYGACDFDLSGKRCKFRAGKVTPKKAGFFVTFWKRSENGPIIPYDSEDPIDLVIFSVHTEMHFGQFVFPKNVLVEKRILSSCGVGGVRATRIYPPWVTVTSKQAKRTQSWQKEYYLEISKDNSSAINSVHLFNSAKVL